MKTAKLSAAIAAVMFGTIAAGTAQAATGASAESIVTLQNFTISHNGTQLDAGNFSTLSPYASESLQADLNGPVLAAPTVDSTTGAPLHNQVSLGTAPAAIASFFAPGGNTPGTEFTSIYPLPMNTNFSGSVTNSLGAPITGLPGNQLPVGPGGSIVDGGPANVNNASYASLAYTGAAHTNSTSTVSSEFKFTGISGVMDFSFDFGAYINAFLELNHGTVAVASYGLQMSLTDDLVTDAFGNHPSVFNTTSGTVNGIPAAAIPVTIFDSNGNLLIGNQTSDNAPGNGDNLDKFFPFENNDINGLLKTAKVAFSTNNLAADHAYTFTAVITSKAEVQYVPEPGMLALMGIGLIGLGVASRKAQKSAHVMA